MIGLETELNNSWNTLWKKVGGVGNPDIHFAQIVACYSESGRFHHSLLHVKDCLEEFDVVKHLAQDPEAVEMALWTHDIYNPKAPDHEEKSAEQAEKIFTEAQISSILIKKSGQLIMVTKKHNPGDDIDEQITSDIDMSILGTHPKRYELYKENVRLEYSDVPLYKFRLGRTTFLHAQKDKLERGELFYLPYFRHKYEENTLYNLEQEIQDLESMKMAVYAGSFDPVTNGHLTVIDRASHVFDNLIMAIGQNPSKRSGRFPLEERLEMLKEVAQSYPNIDVTSYPSKVLIDFVHSVNAKFIVRGLRNEGDYTEESAMDEFNIKEHPEIVTWFTRTPDDISRISSSFVMGLLPYDDWEERIKCRVPEQVFRRIADKRSALLGL